jgi:hypothetical protein
VRQRPDFVIAGAPKCGTTALFEYLSAHPDIFMPPMKEPGFFCTDLQINGRVSQLSDYRALFAAAPASRLTGEASTLYLYSQVAIQSLMAHNPQTRVIVMLRNPSEAAHSLHAARWSRRLENLDFEQAWRAQKSRLAGKERPPGWPDAATLQYGRIYRYAEQWARVLRHVPEAQRHILIYEEFFADPHRHFARLLEFLAVSPAQPGRFSVVNAAVQSKSRRLEQLLREPPDWLKAIYAPLRPLLRATHLSPAAVLWKLNGAPGRKSPLRPEFRAELDAHFAPDIAELERLLGRPLWRQMVLEARRA